jgi:catechol 2,3-dioxygenase-like lactoylglutathione lyase family enzyme
MLATSPLVAFLATRDAERSRRFYERDLGLPLVEENGFAIVFDVAGTMLRIQKIQRHTPPEHTVLGWRVESIETAVAALGARGVRMERFAGMEQDAAAIWTSPSGARIAWFRDPDGNLLSMTQF